MIPDGYIIIEDPNMIDVMEDWSQVRSPARARRRRAKHPQRIVIRHVPKSAAIVIGNRLIMHPEIVRQLREHAILRRDTEFERIMQGWPL